ncbi:MAG TPA: hypothetical protein VHC21_03450 [Candidatus Saccharimonadales bacterium]|nr:hypothetical protein [Candidatus Saccharimonadales bacterium]
MGEIVDIRQGINLLVDPETRPLCPEALDAFMNGFDRQAALGKIEADPKGWQMRLEFLRDKMRVAQVAHKAVAVIASDALTLIEEEPEKFAELPAGQQVVLNELARRVITEE